MIETHRTGITDWSNNNQHGRQRMFEQTFKIFDDIFWNKIWERDFFGAPDSAWFTCVRCDIKPDLREAS